MDLIFNTNDQSTEMKDAIKCQKNLYNIPKGSFPLARDLGLSWDLLSQTTPEAESEFAAEVVSQTQKYEPRVVIRSCRFEENAETGEITAIIEQGRP